MLSYRESFDNWFSDVWDFVYVAMRMGVVAGVQHAFRRIGVILVLSERWVDERGAGGNMRVRARQKVPNFLLW